MVLAGKPSVARSLPLFRSWSACMKTKPSNSADSVRTPRSHRARSWAATTWKQTCAWNNPSSSASFAHLLLLHSSLISRSWRACMTRPPWQQHQTLSARTGSSVRSDWAIAQIRSANVLQERAKPTIGFSKNGKPCMVRRAFVAADTSVNTIQA